jgi:hypothetical protein
MQIRFESRHPGGAPMRAFATERLSFALRRLSWLVPRATVVLSDMNGSKGGLDKRCRVELTSPKTGPVVISTVAKDWRTALDSAVGLAAQTLFRSWQKIKDRDRTPPRPRQQMTLG